MAKKRPEPELPGLKAGGDFLSSLLGGLPNLTRLGGGLALRHLATQDACIETVARAMCDEEEVEYDSLTGKDKRDWKYRARAALVGLDRYLAGVTK
jgi:hypothetical protein